MILLTTSHRPTRRVRSLCNDLTRSIPGLVKVNRGKMTLSGVAERTLQLGAEKFILIDRWKGGPGRIRLFRVVEGGFGEEPPRLYISGVKLRREFSGMPARNVKKPIKSLFLEASEDGSQEIDRFKLKLSEFLELPMLKLRTEPSDYEACMRVADGDDCWANISFFLLPGKIEVGPRMKISHVVWDV